MTAPEKLQLNSNMSDNKSDYATANQAVLTSTLLLILFAYGPQM